MSRFSGLIKFIVSISVLGCGILSSYVLADDVYDTATNQLYIPSVQVGNETYIDVVVTIDQLLSVGGISDGAIQTYNLKSMYEALVKNSASHQFTLKGSFDGDAITGTGSQTNGKLATSVFQGLPALAKTSNLSMFLSIGGQVIPSAASGQYYYDVNYNYLGQSGPEFEVVTSRNPFPTDARMNDAGILYSSTIYTSQEKREVIGKQTSSYSISYDSESSIMLTIISIRKNLAGSVIQTNTALYRVTNNNVVTYVLQTANTPEMFLTISF